MELINNDDDNDNDDEGKLVETNQLTKRLVNHSLYINQFIQTIRLLYFIIRIRLIDLVN